ncbi:MAG: T9SS type A sorting domain-containing protein [Opitutaceae bacterium]|nr:T9SS type A sorting domain-containing protein [Cytophagales bacterium]
MNKKTYMITLMALWSGFTMAGGPDLNVLNTTGGTLKNKSFALDFSIGEVMVMNIKSYTTGFLQPQKLSGPLSVSNFKEDSEAVSVFPNPVTNFIHWNLTGDEVKKVVIFTISGNKIMEAFSSESKLNIENLNPGMYTLELFGEDNKLIKVSKIVKN